MNNTIVRDGLVSVIITTYYREEALCRAIEGALNQTYNNVEVIVVDDSGESYAKEIASEYDRVKYISHNKNRGQIEGWHTGYAEAEGDFIQLHDDDDWIDPAKLEHQVKKLNQENAGVVFSDIKENYATVIKPKYDVNGDFVKQILSHNSYPCQTTSMLIRSNVLEDVFPLNYYPGGTDIVLQIELSQQTDFCYLSETLTYRDTTGESQGASNDAYKSHLQMIKDYSHIYNRYSKRFKSEVKAERWQKLGRVQMRDNYWSLPPILSFARALYIHPGVRYDYLQLLMASLGGKPGFYIGKLIKSVIS